jgi:lysophospholipase L1-like esterase
MKLFTYLALGDSYTIGEGVLFQNNFPSQTVQLLRSRGMNIAAPEILAKTGWTTHELLTNSKQYQFLPRYDFVSLLIGVNNQYRGLKIEVYKTGLEQLISKAIMFTENRSDHVALMSIPDYSCTPFAASLDKNKIAKEIIAYNELGKELAFHFKLHYIDIAGAGSVDVPADLIAQDGLHPSEKEYRRWANKLSDLIFHL